MTYTDKVIRMTYKDKVIRITHTHYQITYEFLIFVFQ